MVQTNERWGSRVGLILAMAGNAVGLGNFLRFPAQAVQNGGGAFIIPYLVSFLLMGIPLLWIEWAVGRHGGQFGHHSAPGMMERIGRGRAWKYVGVFGIFTNLAVAAYYAYIESWTLGYVWYSLTGAFAGQSAEQVSHFFSAYLNIGSGHFLNISGPAILFFLITISINIYILSRGLAKGVEIASKIGMPLLLVFGAFLAIRALTLNAGEAGAVNNALDGLNFLWQPQFDSLTNPKVWLAAAGQIFFTLSVGMGTIQCYAAYLREKDDIALNAATAGWMNEFVEVILGGSIIIPIAVAYLGLPWIQANVGFEMGFRTMPTLFQNWGPFLAAAAGVAWFGLLFFAGITSSLAMGQPVMAFLQDEFNLSRKRSALTLGGILLMLSAPCLFLYEMGAFGEYDYWAGTFSLVAFALLESIAFAWVFGIDKGWEEINRGADIKVPHFFKFVIKYVTPLFLLAVFVGSLLKPEAGNWAAAFGSLFSGGGWPFAADSVIGTVLNVGIAEKRWFIDGMPTQIFILNMTRLLLLSTFIIIGVAVYAAWRRKGAKA
ncbi:MAG TPA: sodium-dependent transporter [bacterium]|nr:sodium-dependent transporter [bacterium]HOH08454.1 sodium-dependent transporter [bacterium]HPM59032.1 sodium-dependent transporter [bacterium]